MKIITASSSELASKCLAPWADGAEWEEHKASWAMRLGSAVHGMLEAWLLDPAHRKPKEDEWFDFAQEFELTKRQSEIAVVCFERLVSYFSHEWVNWLNVIKPEKKFAVAYDLSVKDIGMGSGRDYSAAEGMLIAGTLDVFAVVNGEARLLELKVGTGFQAHPSRNAQVMTQAFMAAKASGVDSIRATLLQVSEKHIDEREHTFDVFDLLEIEERMATWAKADVTPKPGEHCYRCRVIGCASRQKKEGAAA